MEETIVHTFQKSESEEGRISLRNYKGKTYVDLRVFFKPKGEETFKPTKKGLTLDVRFLGELLSGIEKACAKEPVTA
ncbi:MAG: transcriptional coactivator p15/PC4 family protein [Nitrospirae bacterium]|nr:transcriptional coactivator p15/PC4 family protein [Nitrospirota bacterium]